jgi:hypothetical protein
VPTETDLLERDEAHAVSQSGLPEQPLERRSPQRYGRDRGVGARRIAHPSLRVVEGGGLENRRLEAHPLESPRGGQTGKPGSDDQNVRACPILHG